MGNNGEAKRDFPASTVFANRIDLGPGNSAPPKRLPADKKSVEQALASLKEKTGFTPPTEADQQPLEPEQVFHGESSAPTSSDDAKTDFLDLVPAEAPKTKPKSKGHEPKKIERAWHSEPERIMEITADPYKLGRAWNSDTSHAKTVQRHKIRENMGLPEKAMDRKEMFRQFNALTEADIAILKKLRWYEPTQIPFGSFRCEKMLLDLENHKKAMLVTEKV